jgi:aminopeptidase N
VELPGADLHLLNASDLTFAAVRPEADSVRVLLERASQLPAAVDRALAVVTGFQMLYDGELPGPELFSCVLGVLASERSPSLVEPCLNVALEVAQRWTPNAEIPVQLEHLAVMAAGLADDPEHTVPALRTLAAAATGDEHFRRLDAAAENDNDLAWRVATRRAALNRYDDAAVEALLERDPDPDAAMRALAVRTAQPDTAAKDDAWVHLFDKKDVPSGPMLGNMIRAFWQPLQDDVLMPYGDRFLEAIPALAGGGMLTVFGLMYGMFPQVADDGFLARARAVAAEPGCDPTVRAALLIGADTLTRMNNARGV